MLATIIISLFVLLILFFVFREYRNEKNYQKTRHEKLHKPKAPKQNSYSQKTQSQKKPASHNISAPTPTRTTPQPTEKPEPSIKKPAPVTVKPKERIVPEEAVVPKMPEAAEAKETIEKKTELPSCEYPKFSHERLVGMGFSEAEALEYVTELITQIETEMPALKEAIANKDFEKVEHITHSIKGSSSTIGSGGVSDLIDAFSFYVQTGEDQEVAECYYKHLERYYNDLKKQYS